MRTVLGVALMAAVILVGLSAARAEEEATASDAEARDAIAAFAKAWRNKETEARLEALRTLGAVDHAKVADRLSRTLGKTENVDLQVAAYRALAGQTCAGKKVVKKLTSTLSTEAKDATRRLRKGDLGFLLDPRTGVADVDSEEGKRVLAAAEARGRRTAALLAACMALTPDPPKKPLELVIFLQDPHDALVIETLGAFARWKTRDALRGILDLYRMYPEENRWETGEVHQAGGTDATAKAEWMSRFGHPNKQKRRPAVVKALRAALEAVTGKVHDSPEALESWMKAQGLRTK